MLIGFAGSRFLPPGTASDLIVPVVASLLRRGCSIATGCAVGADAAVISAALAASGAGALQVFCAFGVAGAGAWHGSAVAPVAAAAAAGASVHWLAGGSLAVPLIGRLAQRSAAMVAACAGGGGLVAFPAAACPTGLLPAGRWQPSGSGTWSSLALAAGIGLTVVVFPLGWPADQLPAWPGDWSPAGATGVWAAGWRFTPIVQQALF
jgi:hypothetical protein